MVKSLEYVAPESFPPLPLLGIGVPKKLSDRFSSILYVQNVETFHYEYTPEN